MKFRKIFVGTLFGILLIWGPIDHDWPFWFAIRIGYLILLPLISWWLLKWAWDYFEPTIQTEDILERTLCAVISLILWTFAVLSALETLHWGDNHWVQTRDKVIPTDDDILVDGSNRGDVFMIAIIVIGFLWFGLIKKKPKSPTKNS